ncbi:bacillithiol system redox-active protein YtxJ [Flavihumibacter fluvii]|uniref:bacillithiol system redox-active protein YtxJ n=1 Tax=Flavihumibacter fluvii TaxID=2838157 RepID=UPI001BDF44BA|nr:bacillithiol system redox-active protein YtxJ [Flavihumibacter fluvii]ULQ54494.1 bacillithiol system redox-active protein YtxJ [Flavihumibacter fluvii]
MQWIELKDPAQLVEIKGQSFAKPQVIFKHSTRCSISSMAKSRLERTETPTGIDFYYLDLIKYRQVSNLVAEEFKVWHESPQLMLIHNGECVYDESHSGINMEELVATIKS